MSHEVSSYQAGPQGSHQESKNIRWGVRSPGNILAHRIIRIEVSRNGELLHLLHDVVLFRLLFKAETVIIQFPRRPRRRKHIMKVQASHQAFLRQVFERFQGPSPLLRHGIDGSQRNHLRRLAWQWQSCWIRKLLSQMSRSCGSRSRHRCSTWVKNFLIDRQFNALFSA